MKSSVSGSSAAAAAIAAALGLSLAGPHRAYAAPTVTPAPGNDLAVTILSPAARATFSGVKPVEISAFYQGGLGNPVTSLELYLDGVKVAAKTLDTPEARGVVSFLVDASQLTAGTHRIVIRATASDAEVTSAKGAFAFETAAPTPEGGDSRPATAPGAAPELSFLSPARDGKVQGTVTIRLGVGDANGKSPYVSLFVDRAFKMLKNSPPYDYDWDTTTATNGYHTVEVIESFDDESQPVAHAQPLRVYVNNPGGRTERRTDLLDAPKPVKTVPHAATAASRPTHVALAARNPRRLLPQRRPQPAVAGKSATKASRQAAPLIARIDRQTGPSLDTLTLSTTPGLSDPFVKRQTPGATARTPLRSLKPASDGDAETAMRATADAAPAPVLRMASVALPDQALTSPFLARPSLPALRPHTVALHAAAAHRATPVRVVSVRPALPKARVALHVPVLSKAHAALHVPADLMRARGQDRLIFNQNVVRLDRPLAAQDGLLFSPLRQVFEFTGGSLTWEGQTRQVSAVSPARKFTLTVGQSKALVNDQAVSLDAAPYLNRGRTMVPLSFLPRALDVDVRYDAATGHLLITSKH